MPTNLTYKDSIISTVNKNQSKTMRTQGKYLEGDVIVTNVANDEAKSVSITPTNSTQIQTITPSSGYESLSSVTVTVNPIPSSYIIPTGSTNITSNGTYTVTQYETANVNITPNLTTTTVIPSETAQNITPGSSYEGLSQVTVNGITNTYVGSSVPQRTNEDLSFSGGSFSGPSGYYASNLLKNISVGALQTPTINSSGLVTASAALGSNGSWLAKSESPKTLQLPTQSATTIVPAETAQTLSVNQKYMTGDVTVAAITPTYVGSSIPVNTSLTVSGPTVTANAGYYADAVTYTMPYATGLTVTFDAYTPNLLVSESGLIQASNDNRSRSNVRVVDSPGYANSARPAIKISVPGGYTTYQLPTLPAQSFTPTTATQTVASTGKFMRGDITVEPIPAEYVIPAGTITLTTNGTHSVSGYADAIVSVATPSPVLQSKNFVPSETSTTITYDGGYDGLDEVTVAGITNTYVGSSIPRRTSTDITSTISNNQHILSIPSGYYQDGIQKNSGIIGPTTVIPSETSQTITNSIGDYVAGAIVVAAITPTYVGTGVTIRTTISSTTTATQYKITADKGYYPNSLSQNIPLQGATTVVPSESATTVVTAGYYVNGSIVVAAITPTYVGSGVTTNPTITVSGPSVTIPAGYYDTQQTKTVASGSVSTPSTTITANPTVSVSNSGLITASVTGSSNVAPNVSAGYISSGTAGTISVTGSTTLQLTTQGSTTVTPSTSTQTVNVTGKYMTGNVTVNPIPSSYTIPTGTTTITSNGTYNVSSYASANVSLPTITFPTSATISQSGQYIATISTSESIRFLNIEPGYNSTTVNYQIDKMWLGALTATANGTYNANSAGFDGYKTVVVNVTPNLTTTVVTATSTTQTITPPSGYVGFSTVTVNAITLVTYYTGITTPTSNFGNNGDIYLVTD